ncbi:MAG: L-seryl-tRNA(Sec) selenium transferase, partial [Melioribacteraceae bacterium]|nr:L-seryl-tRNA(Sec) selenium transferase [Melioribacteraceae bacterium]
CHKISNNSLKRVINTTGIILHTNLGRAPLGKYFLKEISPIILGYSNIELDISSGKRGKRTDHLIERIKFLTGAEGAAIVNNNAAAVSLTLQTLVRGKEVIISRGELIEIGDSFRLPEIMAASGAKIVEVGTTNRTKLSDYTNAISDNSGMILKAHKSNYYVSGFTEDVKISELSKLAEKNNLIFVYDIGSGLLRSHNKFPDQEPNVRDCLKEGPDLITFSCDKLLGGPQAGIIVGNKKLISIISKNPLMRTYRVDKIIIGLLNTALEIYLRPDDIIEKMPLFEMLNRSDTDLLKIAEIVSEELTKSNISNEIIHTEGYSGGGTLPNHKMLSYSIKLIKKEKDKKFAEEILFSLLENDPPILGILKQNEISFNVLTLFEEEIPILVNGIKRSYEKLYNGNGRTC